MRAFRKAATGLSEGKYLYIQSQVVGVGGGLTVADLFMTLHRFANGARPEAIDTAVIPAFALAGTLYTVNWLRLARRNSTIKYLQERQYDPEAARALVDLRRTEPRERESMPLAKQGFNDWSRYV